METAAIGYRVVDFLKKSPPFQLIDDADLLALAADGRVKFYQANDYILWQGEPHKAHVFVIQQGTVSLWDDKPDGAALRDVRGQGDLLGVERFDGARSCPHSARAESDVLIYAFPEGDFAARVLTYPHARAYVATYSGVTSYKANEERRDPTRLFVHNLIPPQSLVRCASADSMREAARRMIEAGSEAIAVIDADGRASGIVTVASVLEWVAAGAGDAQRPVAELVHGYPATLKADATVGDAAVAMSASSDGALAVTTDGTRSGRLQGVVTARDLAPVFGDQPGWILQQIARADDPSRLRALNYRARTFVLRHLSGPSSVDWLARFTHAVDAGIVGRLIAQAGAADLDACWSVAGAAGRCESLTLLAPHLVVIGADRESPVRIREAHARVEEGLEACGYLQREPTGAGVHAALLADWQASYLDWVRDPVRTGMYRARPLFDLRAVAGNRSLWERLRAAAIEPIDTAFLYVLANDCLANLPPLTFFQDAVVEESGEQTAVFRLEESVLGPLVDVGRVFGLAARTIFGRSTPERLATARTLFPEHAAIFREAAETFAVVLWQQGRVGISQGTSGFELPPDLLGRYDRQVLKSGFRSILRLLEFTADPAWLETL